MKKVLVTPISCGPDSEPAALFNNTGYELIFNPERKPMSESALLKVIAEAGGIDAIVAGLDELTAKVIDAASPRLKIIAKYGVGYNNVDLAAAKRHNILITTTRGANAKSVADLTLALLLNCCRHVSQMDALVRTSQWHRFPGVELAGKTLAIIGLGNIGTEVAKRAQGFDLNIIACDIVKRPEVAAKYGVTYVSLDEAITRADFLSLHAPAKEDTLGMINASRLRSMKPSAFLINTARGDLIVEDDLYTALHEGWIAGAGLDVFVHEPFTDRRFFTLDNILLTPHAAANTADAVRNMGMMSMEEVVRFFAGQAPYHPLQF